MRFKIDPNDAVPLFIKELGFEFMLIEYPRVLKRFDDKLFGFYLDVQPDRLDKADFAFIGIEGFWSQEHDSWRIHRDWGYPFHLMMKVSTEEISKRLRRCS